MPGVILSTEIIDNSGIKFLKREIAAMRRDALRELAEHFHREYVPARFTPGNESRYRHEKRNEVYKKEIKRKAGTGQGKFVNNILQGNTKRRAMAFGKITGTANTSTLKVETPLYFRRPFVGSFQDKDGRTKRVTRQPDKVAETVRVTEKEKAELRAFFQKALASKIKAHKTTRRVTV